MATYSIDSSAQGMRTTGVVAPVMQWIEDATTGKRSKSKTVQDHDEQGMPLWAVEVSYLSESFGQMATAVASVTVPAPTQPTPAAFEPVNFVGLVVSVSVNKANGALREYWNAQGIAAAAGRKDAA